jgi:hypothetical protein
MGWRKFWKKVEDDIRGTLKAIEDNPLEAAVSAVVGYFTGGTGWAVFAATSSGYGNYQAELAAQEAQRQIAQFQAEAQGRDIMVREPVHSRKLIYGEVKAAGNIVFLDVTDDNKYLHLVMAVASHEVQQMARDGQSTLTKKVFLNDEAVTLVNTGTDANGEIVWKSGTGSSYYDTKDGKGAVARFKFYDGTQTQADADLVAESSKWTASHVLNGIAYVYARYEFHRDSFPTGIPNLSMIVRGKKVYDPDTATTAYSTNPVLCLRDYLASDYGFKSASSDFDDTSFITAKDVCDETVSALDGGTTRFTMNGVVDTGKPKAEVLREMLTSFAGDLVRINGKWHCNAGEHRAATITLDEDDCRGVIDIITKTSRRDRYNAVRGTFISPENDYTLADYPEITNAAYQTEDGEKISTQIDLPFTSYASTAQRLAKINLLANRQELVVRYPAKLTAFRLKAGDTVAINNEDFGWSGKLFRVQNWTLVPETGQGGSPTIGIDLILRETASEIYDWDFDTEETGVDPAPNTNLPSPFDVGDVGLSVDDEIRIVNGTATTVLVATVSGGGELAESFQVEAKKSTDSTYTLVGRGTGTVYERLNVEDGVTYDVRAFAINALGVRSPNFTDVSHQVIGKTARPANVTGLRINVVGSEAHLSWEAVADLDLSHYQVRFSTDTSSPSFQNAVTLIPKVTATSVTVPARTGTYFVRAVDTSGNTSEIAASVGTDIQSVAGLNVVATSTQHPTFSGTKTDCVVDEDSQDVPVLKLATAILFDAKTGNFDDATGQFDSGGGEVDGEGEYEFDTYVDLGSKYTSRVTADLDVIRIDYVNLFDDAEGNFDDRQGLFDGDPDAYDDTNVDLFVATTDDDPAGTPTWSDWKEFVVGDYSARALKFKAVLTTTDEQATPAIRELAVEVDMPDSLRADNDIASGTAAGGKVVTFSPAYKDLQGLAIVAQDLSTGDFYDIVSKDATGFTIRFKNSGGTVVDRTFDYVAKGYGELVT